MRRLLTRATAIIVSVQLIGLVMPAVPPVYAATPPCADPAFARQWIADESRKPDFWGLLATATNGFMEPYQEAQGGTRLVQYFDKGRMELTNGALTNGLLATELLTGRVQLGDGAVEQRQPSTAAMVGDQGGGVATYSYRTVGAVGALTRPARPMIGAAASFLQRTNEQDTYGLAAFLPADRYPQAMIGVFDAATQHNVPLAFAAYRSRAGLAAIGYAMIEPFWASVTVGGQPREALVQVFERRVLTYTPDNPTAFQVEMGNTGRHYNTWRYGRR